MNVSHDLSEPKVPPEIEYTIFTDALAIKDTSESVINLLLVAKRVHMWYVSIQLYPQLREKYLKTGRLIPKITETIAIRAFPPAQHYPTSWNINLDSLTKFGIHTRNLFLWVSPYPSSSYYEPLTARYISLCPNLTNLVLWSAHSMDIPDDQLDQIAHLHALTHLSINLKKISSTAWENPDLMRVFKKITHLHNVAIIYSSNDFTLFDCFTSLTHLTFPFPSDKDLISPLLIKLPKLEVLVVLNDHPNDTSRISVAHAFPSHRFCDKTG